VKNLLLVNAALLILFLSDTYEGSAHDKRIADTTPYPLPQGSRLLQDLGFLAFTIDGVEIIMPTKKPRGGSLSDEQKAANQQIARRRVRIEHVNSSVKRCRIVKDTIRLFKEGIVNLIPNPGSRLADSKQYGTLRDCQEGTWRIKLPFARPLSCSRSRTVPGVWHDTALRQGDDGGDKSAHESDRGQPESVGRGPLI